jgi:DNA-binding NtrC family response regulator
MGYDWPGNIRELEHVIERSVVLTSNGTIQSVYLPVSKTAAESYQTELTTATKTLQEQEKEYILKILKQVNGRISGDGGAAQLLGMPPSTLNSRLKKLGIHREHHG